MSTTKSMTPFDANRLVALAAAVEAMARAGFARGALSPRIGVARYDGAAYHMPTYPSCVGMGRDMQFDVRDESGRFGSVLVVLDRPAGQPGAAVVSARFYHVT